MKQINISVDATENSKTHNCSKKLLIDTVVPVFTEPRSSPDPVHKFVHDLVIHYL